MYKFVGVHAGEVRQRENKRDDPVVTLQKRDEAMWIRKDVKFFSCPYSNTHTQKLKTLCLIIIIKWVNLKLNFPPPFPPPSKKLLNSQTWKIFSPNQFHLKYDWDHTYWKVDFQKSWKLNRLTSPSLACWGLFVFREGTFWTTSAKVRFFAWRTEQFIKNCGGQWEKGCIDGYYWLVHSFIRLIYKYHFLAMLLGTFWTTFAMASSFFQMKELKKSCLKRLSFIKFKVSLSNWKRRRLRLLVFSAPLW